MLGDTPVMRHPGTVRATRQTDSLRMLLTGYGSYRNWKVSLTTNGVGFGTPQGLLGLLGANVPFCTRSPAVSDSAGCSSNGMNGSTMFDSDVLVPFGSVAMLRKRSVWPMSASATV